MHLPDYQQPATIAAIATAPGTGAIAILRISGPDSIAIAQKIFTGPVDQYASHSAHAGHILAHDGSIIDHVLLIPFRAPRSYTGHDTVEIHCHGGSFIARQILTRILEVGARPALPGEFTLQAFLNGKLDLAQAEAVQMLIASKSELARQSACQQLDGALSAHIQSFQKELTRIAAILEAWVDFPEEGLEFTTLDELLLDLEKVLESMRRLHRTFHDGKAIHSDLSLCLIGSPNVGKSSLMNALLGKDRAIVTEIPGTTRDSLEEELKIHGMHFRLIDTAGIRETDEMIEQEGVRRSRQAMQQSDLILLILDASRPMAPNDTELLKLTPPESTIIVWNKTDLALPSTAIDREPAVLISAKNNQGIDALKEAIQRKIWKNGPPSKEEVVIASLRHFQAIERAIESAESASAAIKENRSPEFAAFDMRTCLNHLGTIIGTNVSEDILNSIFSQFCVGK
ncbi:MAG: trmE [Parachlamydiales bacterium]|nr:trmE [Parachlamydiales bacterium]